VNQNACSSAGGVERLVKLLDPANEETLLEMAAGAICALCETNDPNKDRFREHKGLEPLVKLLDHQCDSVKLNAAKALCHLAENDENLRIIPEMSGALEKLVKLLSQ